MTAKECQDIKIGDVVIYFRETPMLIATAEVIDKPSKESDDVEISIRQVIFDPEESFLKVGEKGRVNRKTLYLL